MIFIGCDPDLHTPAFASIYLAEGSIHPGAVVVVKSKGTKSWPAVSDLIENLAAEEVLPGRCEPMAIQAAAVEAQEIVYTASQKRNPRDIVILAAAAGACAYAIASKHDVVPQMVLPGEWKGSQSKKINQGRTCEAFGWKYEIKGGKDPYCVPVARPGVPDNVKGGDWKHALDAYGIALWLAKDFFKRVRLVTAHKAVQRLGKE